MKAVKYILTGAFSLINFLIYAQSIPVGTTAIEEYYRRSQISGSTDPSISYTIKPIKAYSLQQRGVYYPDSSENSKVSGQWQFAKGALQIKLLSVTFNTQLNTHHPYGWNDGAMIPSKGLQALVSGGVFIKYGPLHIQFQPEFVSAQNSDFETFNKNEYPVLIARYYDLYNKIDLPSKYGYGTYKKANWGQSSITLNYKGLAIGASNENLWWGPGLRNSLLMSNTAAGFKHLTLNTTKPIKTAVGSFEGQIIGGSLENANIDPLLPGSQYYGAYLYVPKPDQKRYLNGLIFTWQPKWVPGLFLGYEQTSYKYTKDLKGISDYLPLFWPIKEVNPVNSPVSSKNEMSALFMRWVWPEEKAEMYFEYGRYNYKGDLRQSILSPDDSRGYVFGFRKMVPFNAAKNENLLIGLEISQLQQNTISKIRAGGGSWYLSDGVTQGYTHKGEVLGAGIGPGANSQTLSISWVKGLKQLGIQFERYVHNNDYYVYAFQDSNDPRRHWVDLSVGLNGEWNYRNFIFSAKLQGIQSLNYQWYLRQGTSTNYWVNGKDVFNLQMRTGLFYRF